MGHAHCRYGRRIQKWASRTKELAARGDVMRDRVVVLGSGF